jgi:hypothetical protein
VSEGVLSQRDDKGVLHPGAYYSKKDSTAECNYDRYDTEPMANIQALEEWRPECEGDAYPLQLITDHKNLEYFMTKKVLNCRWAGRSEFLTPFHYETVYMPGKSNRITDALRRSPEDIPEGGDERKKNIEQVFLQPQNLGKHLHLFVDSPPPVGHSSISVLMREAYETELLPGRILEVVQSGESQKEITLAECTEQYRKVQY